MQDKLRAWNRQLYIEYDQICYMYQIKLQRPLIDIRPLLSCWGRWDGNLRILTISQHLIERYSWDIVVEILKHEMAHQIVQDLYLCNDHHGKIFKEACQRLAVSEWASSATVNPDRDINTLRRHIPGTDRIVRRVQKLLALASSDNEHESLAAMRKVREIYRTHQIESVLKNEEETYDIITICHKKKRIPNYLVRIGSLLAAHFGVSIIYNQRFDAHDQCLYRVTELMGTDRNLQIAEYVYWFLFHKLPLLWDCYCRKVDDGYCITDKNSFFEGVITGFDEQLAGSKDLAEESKTNVENDRKVQNELLIVAGKKLELFVKHKFPRLVTSRGGKRKWSEKTFKAGCEEGRKLRLHRGLKQGNKTIIGYLE